MCADRDWIVRTLAHEETDAVPFNFSFTPPVARRLALHYGTGDIEEALAFPIRMTGLKHVKPLYATPAEFGETATDAFGVTWSTSDDDRGAPIGPCLPEPDLAGYRFPDPTEARRFEDIGDWCERNAAQYRILWAGDFWERATFMRGMEDILIDLALNPAFVEALLDGISDYILQTMRILFDRFDFDGVAVSDDYGTQHGMLISPSQWRSLIKPRLAGLYEFARSNGKRVFHHTCGDVRPIIGDMIDIGLDILHPIQPEAMDILDLKREFGSCVTFCGGVRTQDLLPRGTPEEVREEVRRLQREMGAGGGFILEPGITLQTDVPTENVIALIDEAGKPL